MNAEFNLLDEPWIRVIGTDCKIEEVSLKEVFARAHAFTDLCGELPTQDVAVLRFLLAVLQTVFTRYDLEGNVAPFQTEDDALDRWEALWQRGTFPTALIDQYLEEWRDRFWLFHPERPFWQTTSFFGETPTSSGASKLNGMIAQSRNKTRLFSMMAGKEVESLSYAEAARWLIHINAYDDNACHNHKKVIGIGYLGQLGLITVSGDNLFQTFMLNLILLDHRTGECWSNAERPVWEDENPSRELRKTIAVPNNLSALYTLQSRRIILSREGSAVIGYDILQGEGFLTENARIEPMTIWKHSKDKKQELYTPGHYNSAKQFWREFSSVFSESDSQHWRPGVLDWVSHLQEKQCLSRDWKIHVKVNQAYYGNMNMMITEIFSDSLTLSTALLDHLDTIWMHTVEEAVQRCDDISNLIWKLAKGIGLAAAGNARWKKGKDTIYYYRVAADHAKSTYYYRVDAPFRAWLETLPNEAGDDAARRIWYKQALEIADELAKELVHEAGTPALMMRQVIEKKGNQEKKRIYSSARAMNQYYYDTSAYRKECKTWEGEEVS